LPRIAKFRAPEQDGAYRHRLNTGAATAATAVVVVVVVAGGIKTEGEGAVSGAVSGKPTFSAAGHSHHPNFE